MIDLGEHYKETGNVPYSERDTYLRETGMMDPQETTGWELDLAEGTMTMFEREELEELTNE